MIAAMSEEPENHTIRLLQEMRAEMRERFDKVDERFEEIDKRFEQIDKRFDKIDSDVAQLSETSGKTIDAVLALSKDVEQVKETSSLVDARLNTIDGRLARIERHTGLVKA